MPYHTNLSFISELTSKVISKSRGYGEYTYQVSPFGSKSLCARTDNVLSPISEVCDGLEGPCFNLKKKPPWWCLLGKNGLKTLNNPYGISKITPYRFENTKGNLFF